MERWCWVREHVKTSLLWTTIKHLRAEGTAPRSQLHCSLSPSGRACPAHTQRRLESGKKLMSVTQEPEVCVLPGKGLGKSLLKSSNREGKGIILHTLSPQYIFLHGFRTECDVPKYTQMSLFTGNAPVTRTFRSAILPRILCSGLDKWG